MPVITGICEHRSHALVVVDSLQAAGFVQPAPEVIADDPDAARCMVPASLRELLLGSVAGTCLGGVAGGVVGWLVDPTESALVSVAAVVILEALDPVLAAGAAVGAMTGAVLGTHAGGSVAVYVGENYAQRVSRGAVLVRLDTSPGARVRQAVQILHEGGVQAIRSGVVG